MGIKSALGPWVAAVRCGYLDSIEAGAPERQLRTLKQLLRRAENTAFGREHQFEKIDSYESYCRNVPIRTYEQLKPWIDPMCQGEPDILWPGKPNYLSKTSGTTSGAKYIPNTPALLRAHIAGARDALLFLIRAQQNASFLDGAMMFLSGSPRLETNAAGIPVGRLSGIVNHFIPAYLKKNQVPGWETNCLEDWDAKINGIVGESKSRDMRLISGIPPWVQHFLENARKTTGKTAGELWPNLQVMVHGGVDFRPYASLMRELMPPQVQFWETYPASESFIAVQDTLDKEGLRLMTSYGTFYEFIPMSEYGKPGHSRLHLGQVQTGVQYALVLTNPAGLWAYEIGDTVRFTSLNPYRIVVTGRTAQYISAFGEHVIVEEINQAMQMACAATQAALTEFIVMPEIRPSGSCHRWYVEFSRQPEDLDAFSEKLNQALMEQNSYYRDLIRGKILEPLKISVLKEGATYAFMKSQGKLGGQNKFPRARNDESLRAFFEEFTMK